MNRAARNLPPSGGRGSQVFPPLNPVTPGHLLVVPGEHESFNVPAAAVIAGAAALRTEMRTGTEDLQDLARAVLEDAGPVLTGPLEARLTALRDAVSQAVNAADDGPKWHAATREEAMTGLGELTAALRAALLADYHAAHGTQGNTGASPGIPGEAAGDSTRPRAEDEPFPAPVFSHHAYGVDVTWLGENGGMAARGHVPDLRFIAACNHLARTEAGLLNIFDRSVRLGDAIAQINRIWAVPIDPAGSGSDWAIRWGDVTGHTPGAFPLTVITPRPEGRGFLRSTP